MKTPEEIKGEYEQNHYRKQRELIDAGKLDFWELTQSNRDGIREQCKEEAEKYPELEWLVFCQQDSAKDGTPGKGWAFNSTRLYYRRLDPLPEEQDDVTELKRIKEANQTTIKMLEKQVEGIKITLRQSKQLTQKCEEETTEALAEVEKYKKGLTKSENDKICLEKDLSRQKNLAKVSTDRAEKLVKENKALEKTVEGLSMECSELHEQVMDYLKDFHTLAMKWA